MDGFVEVTSESWLSRLFGSIKSVVVGLILFLAAIPLLFWNEGRAVKTARALEEGAAAVRSVTTDRVSPENEGKLIHLTGEAVSSVTLTDPAFGISESGLRLERKVEMFQWDEETKSNTRKKIGGGTETVKETTYVTKWSSNKISSSKFKQGTGHQNPTSWAYDSTETISPSVTIGAFSLPASVTGKIGSGQPLQATEGTLPAELQGRVKVADGYYYLSASPSTPTVGDLRVRFSIVRPTVASIVAKQSGNSLTPYTTKNGRTIELVETGPKSADAMFTSAKEGNAALTWILRLVGFVVMWTGFGMIFKPLVVMADLIPFLGSILGFGAAVFSFIVTAPITLVTIAVGWIFYRPLLAILLLLGAGAVVVGGIALALMFGKRKPA
jgi:hypothetical protein